MKKLFAIILACYSFATASAQENRLLPYKDTGWYFLDDTNGIIRYYITPAQLISEYKSDLGLTHNDSLIVIETHADSGGTSGHARYRQYYHGYEVENASLAMHTLGDSVEMFTTDLIPELDVDISNPISEDSARNRALTYVGADEYWWQDSNVITDYRESVDDSTATYPLPPGKLMIARQHDSESNYAFVWRFNIRSLAPADSSHTISINAQTGTVFDDYCDFRYGSYSGSHHVETYYYGWKLDMWTFSCTFCINYRLESPHTVHTFFIRKGLFGHYKENVTSSDNVWSNSDEQEGGSAHWVVGKVWDYFSSQWGRSGVDGNNKEMIVNARWKDESNNDAAYSSYTASANQINVGKASDDNSNRLSTYDIMGHEYTHGIVAWPDSKLHYTGESGALEESFADIFGTAFERYMKGTVNWTMGEDAGVIQRSLQNPHLYKQNPNLEGQPIYYGEPNFWQSLTDSFDNYGVHQNSGVPNYWFYLLAQSIGFDKAAKIAWCTMTNYLDRKHESFYDAKIGSVTSAQRLFGKCSFEARETERKWSLVGVTASVPNLPFLCFEGVMNGQRVARNSSDDIQVFPTPADNVVQLRYTKLYGGAQCRLTNMLGMAVLSTRLEQGAETFINVTEIPSGTYQLSILADGDLITKKVQIIH